MTHLPTAADDHIGGKSRFAIQPVKRGLRVGDDRLDLDDEQCAEEWVKRKDVDRPTLAPDRERDLDVNDPPKASEKLHERIDQPGMCLVDQAVESLASPSKVEVNVRAECGCHPQERANCDTIKLASIDGRHQRTRDAGPRRDVLLASILTDPERPKLPAKSESIHDPIVMPVASPRLM